MFMGEDDGRDEDLWIQSAACETEKPSGDWVDLDGGNCVWGVAVVCFSAAFLWAICRAIRWGWFQ